MLWTDPNSASMRLTGCSLFYTVKRQADKKGSVPLVLCQAGRRIDAGGSVCEPTKDSFRLARWLAATVDREMARVEGQVPARSVLAFYRISPESRQ